MHEMAIVGSIIDTVCTRAQEIGARKVATITLHVGEVRDIHESLLQRYFDWFSKGTLAEGVEVTMITIPLRYTCDECGAIYGYDLHKERIIDLEGEPSKRISGGCFRQPGSGHDGRIRNSQHGEHPHCLKHPHAQITVTSGTELYIDEIGVI